MQNLTVDFSLPSVPAQASGVFPWVNAAHHMNDPNIRRPWKDFQYIDTKGTVGEYSITLNPDTAIEDYNNKKKMIPILILFLKNNPYVQRHVVVYEWGERGMSHGKLHFHMLVKVSSIEDFKKTLIPVFNVRRKYESRTFFCKKVKDKVHRETMLKYMKKEVQNRKKCLFHK